MRRCGSPKGLWVSCLNRIPTINEHLTHIFQDNELEEKRTIRKFRIVQTEGTRQVEREVSFYNLDAIIAVGYRVNSKRATQFRIWATSILKEYLVKGFALDDERFKKGQSLTHFRELLERIRAIRILERVFYQQIKDIYYLQVKRGLRQPGADDHRLFCRGAEQVALGLITYLSVIILMRLPVPQRPICPICPIGLICLISASKTDTYFSPMLYNP